MTYICPDIGRIGPSDLGVHICTVHIYETTVLMYGSNHRPDGLLEDTVCGRVRDHTTGENLFVLLCFLFPVRKIRVTLLVALDHTRFKSCLHTRRRIRAVRRCRNEQHLTCILSLPMQVFADDYQTRIFACRTGCRLQGTSIKTGDGAELFLEFIHHHQIALYLIFRCQRMDVHRAVVGDRNHRRCRIELHRTRT